MIGATLMIKPTLSSFKQTNWIWEYAKLVDDVADTDGMVLQENDITAAVCWENKFERSKL